jgi:carbonic anhydrase
MHHIQELRRRGELSVYVVTVAGVVGINLLVGIALGLALAVGRLLWHLGKVQVHMKQEGDVQHVRVSGALTFVGVPKLSAALAEVPMGSKVHLDLDVETMDHSGYEALESWSQTHRKTGGDVRMEPLEDIWRRKGSSAPPLVTPAVSPNPAALSTEGAR